MSKHFKIIMVAAFAVPLLSFTVAYAHVEEANTSDTTTAQTTESNSDGSTLEQRIQKRKDTLKTKLTKAEESKIKLKCKTGQGSVKNLSGKIKGLETSRNEVYTHLVDRLTKLSDRLKTAGLDTTELDSQIAVLKTDITKFKTDLSAYKQNVSDLAEIDCVADPTGFKAALETARSARELLAKDSAEIKAYVTETIKVTLQALKSQLEKSEGTE